MLAVVLPAQATSESDKRRYRRPMTAAYVTLILAHLVCALGYVMLLFQHA